MNDRELLSYLRLHSRTELALFSREHVDQLLRLAGRPELAQPAPAFIRIDAQAADGLEADIRRRDVQVAADAVKLLPWVSAAFMHFDDPQYTMYLLVREHSDADYAKINDMEEALRPRFPNLDVRVSAHQGRPIISAAYAWCEKLV